ncbi:hypothetical protein F4779DRAFT_468085 [Xylariaceae sp. FL0662B]|nr:hypothetical protein F4779DRAFT_468085 [Xylariaceae sp. FL0662B]
MDRTNTSSSQAKSSRSRNSDIRKEQNRIASRAYREKRKQKLALLNEILKSDSQTDSMSSVSDEADGYHTSLPFSQSRHASHSPTPAVLPLVSVPSSPWPAASPPMASGVQAYSQGGYDSCWMDSLGPPPNDEFPGRSDYVHPFIPADAAGNPLGTATQYIPSIPSVAALPPTPPLPLDPLLADSALARQGITNSPNFSVYDDEEARRQAWAAGLEEDVMVALECFAKLNSVQQQQVLAIIQKGRSPHPPTTSGPGFEYRFQDFPGSPPLPDQYLRSDLHKNQCARQSAGSPIPSGQY